MKKLRILLLNFEYPPIGGGASPVSKEIAIQLKQKGHQITVVTMAYGQLPHEVIEDGIHIFRIPCGRKASNLSHPIEHLRFLRQAKIFLKSHLENRSYDVCHCHFILSTGILARWVKKRFGIPYIITAHGSDLPGYNPDRFKMIHWITPRIIRKILADCKYIISPSIFLGSLIQPFLDKNLKKLKIVPNGIKPENFKYRPKEKIILSTGRLLRRKGFHTLISAVSNIQSEYELHICGDGPMMMELKKLAETSQTKVVFHGWIDNNSEKYLKLLASASIYCLVSSFENASISLLEAMANGCAVITSDVTGCPETIGTAGICVPPEKPGLLSEKISDFIKNPNKSNEFGESAKKRVKEKFLWETICTTYEELLIDTFENHN